jgi:arylamine N-acetyltransferase
VSDLDAYLDRIGYQGARTTTLAVLGQIQAHHLRTIPFENLDPLLGRGVSIDLPAVRAKMVGHRRGGYCFEHNGLMHDILTALGFTAKPLIARVIWMLPGDAPPAPRTHRLTQVELPDGPYLVDVGFGGQSPPGPLRLDTQTAQTTDHGTYRIVPSGAGLELQMQTGARWSGMYRFALDETFQADFDVANWYTSTHPRSRFTQNLVASILHDGQRWNILNRVLSRRQPDGRVAEQAIDSPAALEKLLTEVFGIDPPAPPDTVWQRLPAS